MEPKVGDELLSHRHFYTSKSLQPLLALVSYETDEEQHMRFSIYMMLLTSIFIASCDPFNSPKYAVDQCIRMINPDDSLYDKYAIVVDYGTSLRYDNKHTYRLDFPNHRTETTLFRPDFIERNSVLADRKYCLLE
jgi:hypothetical protein